MQKISPNFLNELFQLFFYKKDIIEVCVQHLKYHYIPNELVEYKVLLQSILNYYDNNKKLPTYGIISQQHLEDTTSYKAKDVQEIISQIKKTKIIDKKDALQQLESYIKDYKFKELYNEVEELYKKNKEDAIDYLARESNNIVNFSLYNNTGAFSAVFEGWDKRNVAREIDAQSGVTYNEKVPFGINKLDDVTHGGTEPTETDLLIARSGAGKTQWLRHRGITCARLGGKVLHITGEGGQKKCEQGYDAAWTAQSLFDIKLGRLSDTLKKDLQKRSKQFVAKGGDIYIYAFNQFNSASIKDIRTLCLDFKKVMGQFPDLLIIDYLDVFEPGNGKRYGTGVDGEKARKEATGNMITNLANEFNLRIATATQAKDVPPEQWNNPEWVMTRHNISGAKNLVNPFSYVFTWNVTKDENNQQTGRIYVDKFREYPGGQTYKIATRFDIMRFYDRKRTLEMFYED